MATLGSDRRTLMNYFGRGSLPTEEHFREFIESTVNKVDDGFDKTPEDGLKITWLSPNTPYFASFYRGDRFGPPAWRLAHDPDRDALVFRSEYGGAVPSLTVARGQVGVNTASPQTTLDVAGAIRSEGRIGAPSSAGKIPADGKWHSLTGTLKGCNGFEVMAGVGKANSGRYAMLHATAMNAYNPGGRWGDWFGRRRQIRKTQSSYGRLTDRLELRWRTMENAPREYCLQIRSRCKFDAGVMINAHITQLWFDERMSGEFKDPGLDHTEAAAAGSADGR